MIAIILDGKIISSPVVMSEAFGGKGQITGNFSEIEARILADCLREKGCLPVPIGRREGDKPVPGEPEKAVFTLK